VTTGAAAAAAVPVTVAVTTQDGRRLSYRVEPVEDGLYLLHGRGGAVYGLLRAGGTGDLFAVNMGPRGRGNPVLPGVWFSDRAGSLEVCRR
jgi:hypothetical protein